MHKPCIKILMIQNSLKNPAIPHKELTYVNYGYLFRTVWQYFPLLYWNIVPSVTLILWLRLFWLNINGLKFWFLIDDILISSRSTKKNLQFIKNLFLILTEDCIVTKDILNKMRNNSTLNSKTAFVPYDYKNSYFVKMAIWI